VVSLPIREGYIAADDAGFKDFNAQPSEPTYSLLVGQELLDSQRAELDRSRVVHISVDPSIVLSTPDGNARSSERFIPNSRKPIPSDGLSSVHDLESQFQSILLRPLRSVYDEVEMSSHTFGQRHNLPVDRKGRYEPMWTSFTPLWRLTLDYLFIWDAVDNASPVSPKVLSVLTPHKTEDLEPGLPRKGLCASDHVALVAELEWEVS